MIRRSVIALVAMLLIAGLATAVSAHHSYLLSVQQLQAGRSARKLPHLRVEVDPAQLG